MIIFILSSEGYYNSGLLTYVLFILLIITDYHCQHAKYSKIFPEIMRPFFSWRMSVAMYFHKVGNY